jgi:hypothetical protein
MPPDSRLVWPVLLHNPYKKDGRSTHEKGRLVLCIPLTASQPRAEVDLAVSKQDALPQG